MKKAFTITETDSHTRIMRLRETTFGFTMAEILLSLTIIGVVAAITLPSLTGNINERTWNTQRKALYARMSQAIALMPALNGYGTFVEGDDSTSTVDTAAETFVTDGLSKVMKLNNICDSEHLEDCGIVSNITAITGSNAFSSFPETLHAFNDTFGNSKANVSETADTKAAAFETANGESILVYYNPQCISDPQSNGENHLQYSQPLMCANFVYDLNGNKGPNTVGKDIGFMSVLYPTDSVVVAPVPMATNAAPGYTSQPDAVKLCREQGDDTRLPNKEELMSMFYNKNLLNLDLSGYWSGSLSTNPDYAWSLNFIEGYIADGPKMNGSNVRCVRR